MVKLTLKKTTRIYIFSKKISFAGLYFRRRTITIGARKPTYLRIFHNDNTIINYVHGNQRCRSKNEMDLLFKMAYVVKDFVGTFTVPLLRCLYIVCAGMLL